MRPTNKLIHMRAVSFNRKMLFEIFTGNRRIIIALMAVVILFECSCKKLVEVNGPVTNTSSADVYSNDATATAVMTGLLTTMSTGGSFAGGRSGLSLYAGLTADELSLFPAAANTTDLRYYTNSLSTATPLNTDFWNNIYPYVYVVNAAIDGISSSDRLTPAIKQQLIGEARFLRAFYYFYLVNLYGDLPIITGTDYTINAVKPRSPQSEVWQQIISDLKEAKNLLSETYVDATLLKATDERVRPTKWAAGALLSRVYLYMQNWSAAQMESDTVISNSSLYHLSSLDAIFLRNSSESIWQLPSVSASFNTADAFLFVLPPSGPDPYTYTVYLNQRFLQSFEEGDNRRNAWIDSVIAGGVIYYYPFKYKVNAIGVPITEYTTLLRLAELYLIRAEAKAQNGDLAGARADLNTIRKRAGLADYTGAMDRASLVAAILKERKVELFTELGHRWLDLKRTNTVDAVMAVEAPIKGGTWETTDQLYPIPLNDLQRNPNLVQNKGY